MNKPYLLRSLFDRATTVVQAQNIDTIVAEVQQRTEALRQYAKERSAEADALRDKAHNLLSRAADLRDEAVRAGNIAERISAGLN